MGEENCTPYAYAVTAQSLDPILLVTEVRYHCVLCFA